ncbi:MAG: septation protein SpoVG family protein [Pirellulales bacterium]
MEITEVRIKLMEDPGERLQAFCSITFDDCFVIRDLKIIEGTNGPFVAMPSRKLTGHCPQCGGKNHLRAVFCNQCGGRLAADRATRDEDGRAKLYADIAHPINSACREQIQQRVIAALQKEIEQAKLPGYVSRYDDIDADSGLEPGSTEPRTPVRQPVEATHIQPPELPHGPHRGPVRGPATPHARDIPAPHAPPKSADSTPASKPRKDGFGAGIF